MATVLQLNDLRLSDLSGPELVALLLDAALQAELYTRVGADRAAEFYSPDQARDERGRWSAGQGGGLAHEYARQKVREALTTGKPYSAEHVQALATHLNRLTTEQLHSLKKEFGLKASGKNKAALIAKLAERFHGAREKDIDEHGRPGSKTYAGIKAAAAEAAQRPGWTNPRVEVNTWSRGGKVALVDHPASGLTMRINPESKGGGLDLHETRTGKPATSITARQAFDTMTPAQLQQHVEQQHEQRGTEAVKALAGQTPGKARQPEPMPSAARVTKAPGPDKAVQAALDRHANAGTTAKGGGLFGGEDLQGRQGLAKLPDGTKVVFTQGEFRGKTGQVVKEEGRIMGKVDGRDGLVPLSHDAVEPLSRALSWRTESAQAPATQKPLLTAEHFLPKRGETSAAAKPSAGTAPASRFAGASGIAHAYENASKLTEAEHKEALAQVDKAPKADLLGALQAMKMSARPNESREALAKRVKQYIGAIRGSFVRAGMTDRPGSAGERLGKSAGFAAERPALDFAALTAGAAESAGSYAEQRNRFLRRAGVAV